MALGFVAAEQLSSGELHHNLLQPMWQKQSLINSLMFLNTSTLIHFFTLKAMYDFCRSFSY